MMTKYNQLIIILFLCFCSSAQVKAQETNKDKHWKSYVQKLPSRAKYFYKHQVNLELPSQIEQDTVLNSSPLVRYLLSEDYQGKGASNLLSTSLILPLNYQSISVKSLREAQEMLRIDTCFRAFSLIKSKEDSFIAKSVENIVQKWEIEYALYNIITNHLQTKYINQYAFTNLNSNKQQRGFSLEQEKPFVPKIKEAKVQNDDMKNIIQTLQLKTFEKKHWLPSFESSVQFSQNYVSENWHKGGESNLNLHTRTYFKLEYRSDNGKTIWNNEIEDKLGLYSAQNNKSEQAYRISSDLLRLRSNFGLKAMGRWYYTLDGEFKTQLFNTYRDKNNTQVLQSAFLAPFHFNMGLGMKFAYGKTGKIYGSKFSFSTNIAPLSFTYKKTFRDDIELSRHGFNLDKMSDYSLGSTIKMQFNWHFNMDISWFSRLYFNTSYSHVETEWENTLNMKIGRYFSTRINLHLRYDDSVPPQENWQRYLQINELLSFGFNYRL